LTFDLSSARLEAKPASPRTPEQLAARAAQGSLDDFGELVKRFEVRLFNFLLRRTGSRSDAEDLTQEAFIRAWERIHRYEPKWRFSTWLFTIGARLAVSHHRRRRPLLRWIEEEDNESPSPLEVSDDITSGAKLWRLAGRVLTPEQHTGLWLRYAEDMSIDEIAVVLKKSQVGVRVMLFRARQVLAEQVQREHAASQVYDAKAGMPPPPLIRRSGDGLAGSLS
jgi:RNA polymerase sigma-70 factor (ECF subfamily)